ncbi:MAG: hypothetical protein ACRDJC_10860 [Thermomicrobiales bacterium]
MKPTHFDRLTQMLSSGASRRGLLRGLAAASGLAALHAPGATEAKNKHKNKKKLKLNSFGCVDVGKPCRGKDAKCCSGICQGEKPRQGEKDRSTCVAHHVGGCQADQDFCAGVIVMCGTNGGCVRTTGKASFCGGGGPCVACRKDKDCEADHGPGAACTVCPHCDGINGSKGTGCVPPAV